MLTDDEKTSYCSRAAGFVSVTQSARQRRGPDVGMRKTRRGRKHTKIRKGRLHVGEEDRSCTAQSNSKVGWRLRLFSNMASYTLTSSPGKVLLAGGYLVLSPAYPGLVIGTDSRFYSLVKDGDGGNGASGETVTLTIHSPQFDQAKWTFYLDLSTWGLTLSKESATSSYAGKSPFLCLSLAYSLSIALQKLGSDAVKSKLQDGLQIWILADNDFYSQRKGDDTPPTTAYLRSLPPFNPLHCAISKVHKTGLGSSAALTTSLVSALLIHLGVAQGALPEEDVAFLHNAAQLAHCAAQGKVGSGFDVSSAVWGSQIFRRFDPEAIKGLLAEIPKIAVEGNEVSRRKGNSARRFFC